MGFGGRLVVQLGLAALIMVTLVIATEPSAPSKSLSAESRVRTGAHQSTDDGAVKRIAALFAGIPQRGAVLGNANAPVTLQFFADLECEEARQFVLGALPFLVRNWVRRGKLRIIYRANPEETTWWDIYNRQQAATLAAGRQGKAWNFLDFFYHEQGPEFTRYATAHFLDAIAAEVRGLDIARWARERHDPALTRHLKRDRVIARRYSIHFTPAFMVGLTGRAPKPLLDYSLTESTAFDDAIEGALTGSGA